jgi:hypothetical protein
VKSIKTLDHRQFQPPNGARFVDLPIELYHTDFSAQSKSMLRRFAFRRSAYKAEFIDCTRPAPPESDASKMGTLAHAGLLRPEILEDLYAVYPDEVLGKNGRKGTNAAAEFEATAAARGRICLKADQMADVRAMVASVESKLAHWLKLPSIRETPLYWTNPQTDLLCRCLPDWLMVANGVAYCFDLKTTASAHPDDFARRVDDQMHWMQQTHYTEGVTAVTGLPCQFRFVVVESDYPYTTALQEIAPNHLPDMTEARLKLMRDLKHCLTIGNFSEPWENQISPIVLRPGCFDVAA